VPRLVEFPKYAKNLRYRGVADSPVRWSPHLLRRPAAGGADVVLIERGEGQGPRRGVCRTRSLTLNVPGGQAIGRFADPRNFCVLPKARLPERRWRGFLPRALYGDYLQDCCFARNGVKRICAASGYSAKEPALCAEERSRLGAEFADRDRELEMA